MGGTAQLLAHAACRVVELLRFGYGARPMRATRGSRDLPALQKGDRTEAWPSGNERKTRKQRGA
jgi:hypothetical protein